MCVQVFQYFVNLPPKHHNRQVRFSYETKWRPCICTFYLSICMLPDIRPKSVTVPFIAVITDAPRNSFRWAAGSPGNLNIAWCRYWAAGERRWSDTSPGEISQPADWTCTNGLERSLTWIQRNQDPGYWRALDRACKFYFWILWIWIGKSVAGFYWTLNPERVLFAGSCALYLALTLRWQFVMWPRASWISDLGNSIVNAFCRFWVLS